jgi:hypothetical protein
MNDTLTENLVGCGNWKPKHGVGPYCGNCGYHEREHRQTYPYPRTTSPDGCSLDTARAQKELKSSNSLVETLRKDAETTEAIGMSTTASAFRYAANEIERLQRLIDAQGEAQESLHKCNVRLQRELSEARDLIAAACGDGDEVVRRLRAALERAFELRTNPEALYRHLRQALGPAVETTAPRDDNWGL